MIDALGFDTKLARLLHGRGRLGLDLLRSCLAEVRARREGAGGTLARVLVRQSALSEDEALACLHELAPDPPETDLTALGTLEDGHAVAATQVVGGPASRKPEDPWRPGLQVDDYVLEERLGAGGMGVVFLARHATLGTRRAVKTLHEASDRALVQRFQREAEAQARVDAHPNVVRVHKLGHALGRHYVVMDVALGGDLADLVRRGLPSPREGARIVRGLARGLAHLHAKGILHRDVKPANVLFDEEGTPKLVDFGIALVQGATRLTLTGETLGTPTFMAPEQALADRDALGPWTDVYSLGAVLYFVLTGESPFLGTTAVEVMRKVVTEAPASPGSRRPGIPPALDALCLEALAKDPKARPTAAAFGAVLDAILEESTEAPRRSLVGPLAVVAVVAVVVLAAAVVRRTGTGPPPSPPAPAAIPPGPKGPHAPAPAVVASDRPASPGPAAGWRWERGQVVRCVLSGGGTWSFGETTVDAFRSLAFDARAEVVEPSRAVLRCTLEGLEVRYSVQTEGERPAAARGRLAPMAYDSARKDDLASPFQRAIGRSFSLELDPRTGAVREARDVAAIQSAIWDGVEDPAERPRFRVQELVADVALAEALDALVHVLPEERPAGASWQLDRKPSSALEPFRGGLALTLRATFLARDLGDGAVEVTWDGDVPSGARELRGKATFAGGRPRHVELAERLALARFTGRSTSELTVTPR